MSNSTTMVFEDTCRNCEKPLRKTLEATNAEIVSKRKKGVRVYCSNCRWTNHIEQTGVEQ